MEMSWVNNYVPLRFKFISEEDGEYLERSVPDYKKFVAYGCPTCRGKGTFLTPNGEVECDCAEQLMLYKHYTNANIGLNYQRLSWEDYTGSDAAKAAMVDYLDHYDGMLNEGFGALFTGGPGLGKTLLSSLIGKELVKLGYTVFFATFAEMTTLLTKGWGNEEARSFFEKKVVRSDVFILDDVGKELRTKTNLAESTFDYVLRSRVANCRPVFITTNLTLPEMSQGYGSALFSLLQEKSLVVNIQGEDFRRKAGDAALEYVRNGYTRAIS